MKTNRTRNIDGRTAKRWRAAAVAATAGCIATAAHAQSWFQFEAAIGGSAYSDGGDGYWYQEGFEHKLRLTAPAYEAGITGDLYQREHWGLSYHLDYVWLGQIRTQSLAVTDADYNVSAHACIANCNNPANFIGSGHEASFIATLQPHYDVGAWQFGVEAGPFFHRSVWTEDVTGSLVGGALHVVSTDGWRFGYVVGASVEYKRLSLTYQYFGVKPTGANPAPPIRHGIHSLMLKYRANVF